MYVPDTLEELLSKEWLTSAMGTRFPGIRVTAVKLGPVDTRVSTNALFQIDCAGGVPDGLSPELCVKGYFGNPGRGDAWAGLPEATFYRDMAPATGMRTLPIVYADVDPVSQRGVLITEDVVVKGARFLDALTDYTPDQTADSLEQLAKLHASTWCHALPDWLAPRLAHYLQVRGTNDIRINFEGPIGSGVPEEVRSADRLYQAYRRLVTLAEQEKSWSTTHGDAHVGNLFLDEHCRPSFADWQCVQRGPWYLDVGYHIASALTVEDRRHAEKDLLGHYLDRLAAGGVDAPSWDEAWLGLRRGIIHGFYMWGITRLVRPEIISALLTRIGTAATDHEVFGSLEGT
jgi:hypothetical protein